MTAAAAMEFLETLQTNFRAGKHESEEHEAKWVAMMVSELKGYSPDVLRQAAKNIVRKRADKYFPILSVCLAACEDAKHWIDQANPRLHLAAKQTPGVDERRRLADELVMGELGRKAAREGWIVGLHDYIRDRGRMPDDGQIRKLKAASESVPGALDACVIGMTKAPEKLDGKEGFRQIDGRDLAAELRKLGLSMLDRRQKLTEMVLDGVVRE